MSFFHLRTLPGYSWPALPNAALSQIWVAYLELDRSQWLQPEDLERRQLAQLRTLLSHAAAHVPYYRRVLAEAGITPASIHTSADFRKLPLLSRATCQARQADLVATTLPAGTVATASASTLGTSGTPLQVRKTNIVNLWWCACFLRDLEWCGVDPSGILAAIRPTGKTGDELKRACAGVILPCWLSSLQALIETGPCYTMDIQQDPSRQLEWLRQVAPDYLLSHAGNLDVLAGLVKAQGKAWPALRAIQSIAEPLTETMRGRIESAFGVPVKNTYSCCEGGYLASPCPGGSGLHVHAENILLEVLDKSGRPCGTGETGRVYLTTLHNFQMPLIRYELGDEATLGPERCPCGRGLSLLASVQGKRQ